ncbi:MULTISPECIES: DHH family phosphoesterase [unclassified Archaeoglobus]|jgi:single-stranded DNA-specific DHH superfamily exonuclease|uniref:DHH family phosphoesterase n=1 Tax=unclassified Archaeoglobus TaxID=2643606 RepID=UPI0025C6B3FE|nr:MULTISPECIES: DHH family phosphoesterase [unclassified Archaeoglobus]
MSSNSGISLLRERARKAADLVERHDFIRVYTHHDADGISAGAIIAKALLRAGKNFQISFLKGLNESFDYEKGDLLLFADMGSGYADLMSEVDTDLVILDHHTPSGEINPKRNLAHVNPHLVGMDGTYELSASGVSYLFATELGRNRDLASMAVVGMLGDKQKIVGGNAEIIKEGIEAGVIAERKGIALHSGKLRDSLLKSLEPYLDFYGKKEELEEFLRKAKLDGDKDVDDLSDDEVRRLSDAVVLRLLQMKAYTGVFEHIIGKQFILKNILVKNSVMLTDIVNSCGRAGVMSLALSLLLGDVDSLNRALKINEDYVIQLLEELKKRRNEIREGFCIRYLVMENGLSASPIATTFSRYLMADKPLVVINIKNEHAKVSARTNENLAKRVDLAEVMKVAAEKVGGRGGGHRVAAGANISAEKVDEFLKEVDRLCCAMLA